MTFEEVLDQAIDMLRRRGRLTYRALKRQFDLDDAYLEDLKEELIEGQQVAVDEHGKVLVWAGEQGAPSTSAPLPAPSATHQPALPDHLMSLDEKLDRLQRYLPQHVTDKILSNRGRLEGERKLVTVLFADIVGYTTLSEQLGEEALFTVMDDLYELFIHAVHRYEGTVNELTGDGIVAFFGAPLAVEQAPQRAVHAALTLQQAVVQFSARLEQERGLRVQLRVGINTGPVIVGTVGNNLRMDYKAVGDTVNLAARMEQTAEPGTIQMTEQTLKLVEGYFASEDLGLVSIKGKTDPIRVYRVTGKRGVRSRLDVQRERGFTRLVGRGHELEILRESFARTKDGQGQAVSIIGEAGLGKSRLLYECRQALSGEDFTFLEGQCSPYGATMAYFPLIDLLRRYFRIDAGDSDTDITDKVHRGLEALDIDCEATAPYLFHLLATDVETGIQAAMPPETVRRQLFEALQVLVLKSAERRPVLIIVEDLHWVDKTTEEFLTFLLDHIASARVMLMCTYRPEFVSTWSRRSYHTAITLRRLSPHECQHMLTSLLGIDQVHDDLLALVSAKADGVPFFLEELVHALREAGAIGLYEGQWRLEARATALQVPNTVEEVLMARIDQLPEGAKRVLQTGAVIGREFRWEVLKGVTDLADQELMTHLGALTEAELLYEHGLPPQSTYLFKHAFTQEAAYRSLLTARQRAVHRRVAFVIEALFPDRLEAYYGLLAHHYRVADDLEKALSYHRRAARAAQRVYAVEEALEHYTQALDIAAAGGSGAEAALVSDLHIQRGRVYAQTGTIDRAHADFEAALSAARAAGNQAGEIQALYELGSYGWATDYQKAIPLFEAALPLAKALDDTASQVRILSRMSIVYTNRLQLAQAFDHGRRALGLARALGDEHTLALSMDSLAVAAAFIGDFTTLDEIAPQLTDIHRRHGDLWYLQFALYQWCYVPMGQGRWDDAIAQLEEALAINRRIGDRGNEPLYASTLCWVYRSRGAYEQALVHGRQAIARSEVLGNTESTAWNAACLGWTLLEVYALEEAVRHLEQGMEAAEGSMTISHVLRCTGPLAWTYWLLGETERAQTLAAQAEALCQQLTVPSGRAFLQGIHAYVAIAWVHLASGEAERARQLLTPVLAAAETCGWQEAIAYGSLVVGQSLVACGDGERAEQALQRALQVTHDVSLPGVAWKTHAALADYYRGRKQIDAAARHQAQAHTIMKQLATTLGDATMRQGFLHSARSQLGEGL